MFVQRQFQRYQKRSADEQHVHVLLKDFDDAEALLTKVIEASTSWRNAWVAILTHQSRLFNEFDLMYGPIVGAGDDYQGHVAVETPQNLVDRAGRIKNEYEDLKRDLTEELNQVQIRMIGPAQDAKDSMQSARKVIKKREDRKLDFERYQSRVDAGNKRNKPTDRDRSNLARAQSELAVATETYNKADEHLRYYLPPLLTAIWSLQPHLLAAQIQIQNSLLAHYYTMLHTFCQEEGFPSPSPPMDEVIRLWEDAFKPTQRETEAMPMIVNGKAVRKSFSDRDGHGSYTNGYRRPSQPGSYSRGPSVSPARPPMPHSPSFDSKTKISTSPSALSLLSPTGSLPTEGVLASSPGSSLHNKATPGFSPAGPNADYFSRDRHHSNSSAASSQPTTPGGSIANIIAGKKKPPPPPPPRLPSQQFQFVTALYDFGGQSDGDLSFREGDRIKVIKKTDSTDDWWQGELKGVKGMFPANYVEV